MAIFYEIISYFFAVKDVIKTRHKVKSLIIKNKREKKTIEIFFSLSCDPGGIQTHDLQNRNLTLYSAKLRNHSMIILFVEERQESDNRLQRYYLNR